MINGYPMFPLSLFRWLLFAFGLVGLLASTLLFDLFVRRPMHAWLQLNERLAGKPVRLPRPLGFVLEREVLLRAWQAVCAVVLLALWWYLGTAAGAARWAALASHTPR